MARSTVPPAKKRKGRKDHLNREACGLVRSGFTIGRPESSESREFAKCGHVLVKNNSESLLRFLRGLQGRKAGTKVVPTPFSPFHSVFVRVVSGWDCFSRPNFATLQPAKNVRQAAPLLGRPAGRLPKHPVGQRGARLPAASEAAGQAASQAASRANRKM